MTKRTNLYFLFVVMRVQENPRFYSKLYMIMLIIRKKRKYGYIDYQIERPRYILRTGEEDAPLESAEMAKLYLFKMSRESMM